MQDMRYRSGRDAVNGRTRVIEAGATQKLGRWPLPLRRGGRCPGLGRLEHVRTEHVRNMWRARSGCVRDVSRTRSDVFGTTLGRNTFGTRSFGTCSEHVRAERVRNLPATHSAFLEFLHETGPEEKQQNETSRLDGSNQNFATLLFCFTQLALLHVFLSPMTSIERPAGS